MATERRTLFSFADQGNEPEKGKEKPASRSTTAPASNRTLFNYADAPDTGAKAEARPTSRPGVDLSAIDKEIAAKRAEIAARQKEVDEAKAKQAADAKYREEHPFLAALRGALGATSDRAVLTSPKGLERGVNVLQKDLAALERRRADSIKQGKAIGAPTTGKIAAEVAKSLPRGAIHAVGDIASLAGIAGKPGEAFAKGVEGLGEEAIKGLGLEQAPEIQYSGVGQRLGQTGEFLGGAVAFAPLEALNVASKAAQASRALKIAGGTAKGAEAAMAAGMGARQARETMDAYEAQTGQELDQATRSAIQAGGGVIGAAFLLPMKSIMSKVAPETAAAANMRLTDILARAGSGQLAKSEAVAAVKSLMADVNATALGRTVTKGALPAGLVMGGMQAGQNLLEMTYNPEQRSLAGLGENVGEAALAGGLGGFAARGVVEGLSARGNANRQAQLEALRKAQEEQKRYEGADFGTFDILSRGPDNKVQREPVKVVSEPDADGNVTVQRADGTRSVWSLEELKKSHAPAGSIRAVPIPETLSRSSITQRLQAALGDFAPDENLSNFIKKTADQIGDAVVLGQPERPAKFLDTREGEIMRKRKISEESRIGHSLVVDEARKILNEYTDLVTAPPERPAPKMAGEEGPPVVTNRLYNEQLLGPEYKPGDTLPKYGYRNISNPAELQAILETGYMLPPEGRTGKYFTMSDRETPSEGNRGAKPIVRVPSERIAFDRAVKAEDVELWDNNTGSWKPLVERPTPRIEEVIQNRAASMQEENARRTAATDEIANNPEIIDKVSTFEDLMEQNGYDRPSPEEIAHLHDAMRLAAERETAENLTSAQVENIHERERRAAGASRVNAIEEHLYDPDMSPRKKIERINAALEEAGLAKLTEDEVNRYQAVADALDVFGKKAEQQRQATAREELGGLEAQIKPAAEQPERVPEPLAIERPPAPERDAEIASEAQAANQRLAEAQARAEQSRAEIDRINAAMEEEQAKLDAQPNPSTPAARQAINARAELEAKAAELNKQLETDMAALNESAAAVKAREEAAPKAEEVAPEQPARELDEVTIMGEEPPKGGLNRDVPRQPLARNWRMSNWYKNFVYQFGGGTAVENALLKALGIDKLPTKLSVKEKLEMMITNRNGMIREINRRFNNPISREIERLYKEYGIHADEVSDALQARAAEQRNARVARNKPEFEGFGSNLSPEDAQAILTDLKLSGKLQKMGKVIKLHDELRKHMQDLAVENGLISREKMDQFNAEEPDYTPFKGWAESGDLLADKDTHAEFGKPEYIRRGLGVNRNIVRKAEGRSSLAGNSLLNLMADAQTMALKAAENKPARTLLDLMEAHPEHMADVAEIVPERGEDTLTAIRDGKAYNIKFKDTDAGNAMKSAFIEIADPVKRYKFINRFERVSALMRGINTTLSPLFWPKAMFKDTQDAITTLYSEQGLKDSPLYGKKVAGQAFKYSKPLGETWQAAFNYLTDATPKTEEGVRLKQMVAEMVEQGGSAGYAFREHAQDIRARIDEAYKRLDAMGGKKALLETEAGRKQLMEVIHGINDFIDLVPRAAAYRASVEAGVPPPAAAKIALEASLNLPRRGRYGTAIDAIKWYTNAGIQSAAKKGRMLRSANGRKVLAGHMALGTALALYNISVAGDKNKDGKNDYLQLPAWRKAMGLTIYSPSGKTAITIPIGFMASFESYLGQKLGEVAYGVTSPENGAAALSSAPVDIVKGFISSQLPLGRQIENFDSPLDVIKLAFPDPGMPALNVLTNENAFGEPIYNEPFNKEQALSSVPRASTPQAYKDWASWLNDNSNGHGKFAGFLDSPPEAWKYLIDQYTGGIGKFVGSIAQGKNPVAGQYVADESRASAADYYQLSPRMRQAVEAFGPTGRKDRDTIAWLKENRPVESNPRVMVAFKAAEKQLDTIKAREARLSKLPADRREAAATKIEQDRQEAQARFLRIYNEVTGKQK